MKQRISNITILTAAIAAMLCFSSIGTAQDTAEDKITTWDSAPALRGGPAVFKTVLIEDEEGDPVEAGRSAARALLDRMAGTVPKAVIVSECFEDLEYKEALLRGIASIIPREKIFGLSSYGSFTRRGISDFDAVTLLGIGGGGIGVRTSLIKDMGASKLLMEEDEAKIEKFLTESGQKLAKSLGEPSTVPNDQFMIVLADAHSPKNAFLVNGLQKVVGPRFPITGGSANKNAGQTYVYYQGKPYTDAAMALIVTGDFNVTMAGRQAKDEDTVIRTAGEGLREALDKIANRDEQPMLVMAFDCAGRRSRLDNMEDELDAIRYEMGRSIPLFGSYQAGEIGPVDSSGDLETDLKYGGEGWHVMFTVISVK